VTGRVSRFWDANARRYDAHYDSLGAGGYALRTRRDLVVELLGEGSGSVLDAGMGAGRLCEALSTANWTVWGIDASAEMVDLARARFPDASGRFAQASLEDLPFDAGSFDAVTATGVLEYTDVSGALAEISRVLRPGGRAVLSFPNPHALYGLWQRRVWYPLLGHVSRLARKARTAPPKSAIELDVRGFGSAAARAGLRVESAHYTGFFVLPPPLDELFPRLAAKLGERLEGRGPRTGRLVATQVVYVAGKPSEEAEPLGAGSGSATAQSVCP
jgi:ubiquinone/menaquinone biosynthesis C-methylase UbiE